MVVLSDPAFGHADLSNCEREQIHFAGSIQPHGVLLLLREPDLHTDDGQKRPLLVRADPVYVTPERVLGYVVMLTDNTAQKAAAAARRRFQDGIMERHRAVTGRIGGEPDLDYRSLLAAVMENAQLAALEITDRADVERMQEMLESVRVSVARTTELLEHLAWHASRRRRN